MFVHDWRIQRCVNDNSVGKKNTFMGFTLMLGCSLGIGEHYRSEDDNSNREMSTADEELPVALVMNLTTAAMLHVYEVGADKSDLVAKFDLGAITGEKEVVHIDYVAEFNGFVALTKSGRLWAIACAGMKPTEVSYAEGFDPQSDCRITHSLLFEEVVDKKNQITSGEFCLALGFQEDEDTGQS